MTKHYFKKYEKLLLLEIKTSRKGGGEFIVNDKYKVVIKETLTPIYNLVNNKDIPVWLFDLADDLRKDYK